MAKVKAPLFGLGARGQLGKALVYFPWKGIDAVREYVIPTNPNTTLQRSQRNKLEAAVDEFHASGFTVADRSAWVKLASILATVMTGFNAFCKTHIDEAVLGNTWKRIANVVFSAVGPTSFVVTVTTAAGAPTCSIIWGTSPTYMPGYADMNDGGGGTWNYTIPGLTANTDYYVTIFRGASGVNYGRVGIYKQRTAAA